MSGQYVTLNDLIGTHIIDGVGEFVAARGSLGPGWIRNRLADH